VADEDVFDGVAFVRADTYRARVGRTAIQTMLAMANQAYRSDPWSALRRNIESVTAEEWDVRPATWSVAEFGTQPELSICDIALHTGAKYMYVDRAFGQAKLEWADIGAPPTRDMAAVLAWLDEAHRLLTEGLAALQDDADLAEQRQSPRRAPMRRSELISIIINHDLYHAGEINRQRALIRGAEGWNWKTASP
jgi:uncharacterized damage-inducible protein DinB